jgi:hypothetical protein
MDSLERDIRTLQQEIGITQGKMTRPWATPEYTANLQHIVTTEESFLTTVEANGQHTIEVVLPALQGSISTLENWLVSLSSQNLLYNQPGGKGLRYVRIGFTVLDNGSVQVGETEADWGRRVWEKLSVS